MSELLYTNARPTCPQDELKRLGVELGSFDPEDEDFLDSNACLFRLLPLGEYNEWSIDRRKLDESSRDTLRDWDKLFEPVNFTTSSGNPSETHIMLMRGRDIFYYIKMLYEHKLKKIGHGDFDYFSEICGWNEIR